MAENTLTAPRGIQGNAWAAAVVGANGTSNPVDTFAMPFVTAFGNASAATTITLQVSADGVTWYDSQVNQVLAGAGDFCLIATVAARLVRLKTLSAATITASILAKGA